MYRKLTFFGSTTILLASLAGLLLFAACKEEEKPLGTFYDNNLELGTIRVENNSTTHEVAAGGASEEIGPGLSITLDATELFSFVSAEPGSQDRFGDGLDILASLDGRFQVDQENATGHFTLVFSVQLDVVDNFGGANCGDDCSTFIGRVGGNSVTGRVREGSGGLRFYDFLAGNQPGICLDYGNPCVRMTEMTLFIPHD